MERHDSSNHEFQYNKMETNDVR